MEKDDERQKEGGTLYLVSTPIGNDDDITLRAIKILQNVDLVVCEEIKFGSRMLRKLNISKKLETLNEQNEFERTFELIELLKAGKTLALVSDCGTPVFADPGALLVKECISREIRIRVIPGVSSIMAALVRSGFNIKSFLFAGFLSRLSAERIRQFERLSEESRTVALLETPYRLRPVLEAAAMVMPKRRAYIGINLTMPYETHYYGTFSELHEKFKTQKFKGEFVICFEGASYKEVNESRSRERKPEYKDTKRPYSDRKPARKYESDYSKKPGRSIKFSGGKKRKF